MFAFTWAVLAALGAGAGIDDPAPAPIVEAEAPAAAPAPAPAPAVKSSRRLARIEDYAPPEAFVQAGGLKTHFQSHGDHGRAIVLLHGFGSSLNTWRFNLGPLGKEHRVFAFDLKGFGYTAKPKDGQYHLEAYARHLESFLEAMKLDKAKPILVGSSMGGAVAARLASIRPDLVGGLVLVDAAPVTIFTGGSGHEGQSPQAMEENPYSPLADMAKKWSKSRLAPQMIRAASRPMFVKSGLLSAYHDPKRITRDVVEAHYHPLQIEGMAEALIAMADPPPNAVPPAPPLETLKLPTLVVWGRHDRILPIATSEFYRKRIAHSRFVVFDNSGHLPHEEEADRFNALISEFVRDSGSLPAH